VDRQQPGMHEGTSESGRCELAVFLFLFTHRRHRDSSRRQLRARQLQLAAGSLPHDHILWPDQRVPTKPGRLLLFKFVTFRASSCPSLTTANSHLIS
jgi:hypothetical protein